MKKKILIIDDEVKFAEMVKINLEEAGLDVMVAYDALQGYKKIKAHGIRVP